MAKLSFTYGTMSSGKTNNLLQKAYDYEVANKEIRIMKPIIDTKGDNKIVSRMGNLSRTVDFLINNNNITALKKELSLYNKLKITAVLIDEAQFLSPEVVDVLQEFTIECDIPVMCFGLRTTFQNEAFIGSSALFAKADDVEEITKRAICRVCGERNATKNLRLINDRPIFDGNTVAIDGDKVDYIPVCSKDFIKIFKKYNN